MIVDLIVSVVMGAVAAVFALIPTWDLPSWLESHSSGIGSFGYFLGTANRVLPVEEVFRVLGVALALQLVLFAWHGITWVYDRIPFKAS